jgi:hypothetical protein
MWGIAPLKKILQLFVGVLFNYENDGVSNGVAILAAILQILTPAPFVISVQWCRCYDKTEEKNVHFNCCSY